ncbi:DUF3300 domain-containing protein [Pararobbsia alpina]|uniref:DUF3300 domain-containing protein n=1 Tax=Pararobbsia alpina TaxID=621374 RepID=A0A6S7BA32_9BURK|nr:DUF3300 domain-containing protein [Pararobbsia alpina]CAB3793255.1 hypothetical protein LMG28138_03494 [Pararobbsia alpina]
MKFVKQGCAVFVFSCLVLGIARDAIADEADQPMIASAQVSQQTPESEASQQTPEPQASQQTPEPQAPQQTPEQLQQLVAPIALYPDALVAQILAASANTVEIVEADRWMQAHPELKGDALAAEVNKQSWDPSVKALTGFPSVLANLDQNLAWTSQVGDAYMNQPQELMSAVQAMRGRAQEAGNLESTGQETVSTQGQSIAIEPAEPDVVYVPQYDPWLVYGAPVAVWPGWYPYSGLYLDGPGIAFGIGFGLGYFGGYGWGWNHWRPDWNRRAVMYNHHAYISHGGAFNRGHFGGNFNHAPGFHGGGFNGNAGSHMSSSQRGLAGARVGFRGNYGRYGGGFYDDRVGRDGRSDFGRSGFGGFAHGAAGGHGGGFR